MASIARSTSVFTRRRRLEDAPVSDSQDFNSSSDKNFEDFLALSEKLLISCTSVEDKEVDEILLALFDACLVLSPVSVSFFS